MPKKELLDKICIFCDNQYKPSDYRQKYCSHRCSALAGNKNRAPASESTKRKISTSLKKYYSENPDKIRRGEIQSKLVGQATKGKYKKNPSSIIEVSKRTASKICKRMKLGCARCGWNEEACDIHHIIPRADGGGDNHENLMYLCPNCHRLAHSGKIDLSDVPSLDIYYSEQWKDFYYG